MPPQKRIRADQLVFEQGLAESREKAKSLIMAGRVFLKGDDPARRLKIEKPGRQLPGDAIFEVDPGPEYVSRGAYKLLTILDAARLDVTNCICLDAGASTGGFTDCLLRKGAAKVYAVDVGKNQLHEKLRADPRVINLEGVNLRRAPADLLPEKVDFLAGDLSFISLTLVLPTIVPWVKPGGLLALLVKPQFELSPAEVVKGVVRKEADQRKAVDKIIAFCRERGDLELIEELPARIKGPKGNQEYLVLFKKIGE